jgi:hypothetical protein
MPWLTILPYRVGETEAFKRNRTSIDSDAGEELIHQKIASVAVRTGDLHHVDVTDPDGKTETWTMDDASKKLVSDLTGATIEIQTHNKEVPMATKVKTKAKSKAKSPAKAKTKTKTKANGDGANHKIIALLKRDVGATTAEILKATGLKRWSIKATGLKVISKKVEGEIRYMAR